MHLHVPNNSTKILSVDGFLNYLNTRVKYLKKVEITQYTTVNKTAKTIINKLQSWPLDVALLHLPLYWWAQYVTGHVTPVPTICPLMPSWGPCGAYFLCCLGRLLLITNRKSYTGSRLAPNSVTLNDLERQNRGFYCLFGDFGLRYKFISFTRWRNVTIVSHMRSWYRIWYLYINLAWTPEFSAKLLNRNCYRLSRVS